MDNLTHTLFALTLARTPLRRAGRGTTVALVLSSSAPDVDIVAAARDGLSYLQWHRGPTHGSLGVVGLGLLTAGLVWLGRRVLDRRPAARAGPPGSSAANASLGVLVAISMIGVLLHVLMDLPTSYGTRLLSPFDWHWYAFDWMPIIDIYLLAVLAAGLLLGRIAPTTTRRVTAAALVIMAANYGVRAVLHRQALEQGPRLYGPLLPQRCDPGTPTTQASAVDYWPNGRRTSPDDAGGKPCVVEIAAVPTFLSPFRWRLIAHLSNAYELHEIDLLDGRLRGDEPGAADRMWRLTLRYPNQWTEKTVAAAATRTGRIFLGFTRFPAARTVEDATGLATVRWSDVRFGGGLLALDQRGRRPDPFNAVVRIAPDGRVLQEQLGR